jgi:6-phosphogluconolactonase (cycloisomerase 2 family)
MAYDPVNARLFAVNNGSDTISVFSVDRVDGSLTKLPYSPFSIPIGQKGCIAVHPSGSPLVVGNAQNTSVASFNITSSSAVEASGSPFTSAVQAFSCAFSRDGSFLYTGGNSESDIDGFSVDASSGVLTPLSGSPFASGANNPVAYAADNVGRLFSANYISNQVRAYTSSSGNLAPVSGNPFPAGLSRAVHGVWHPAGFYLVADRIGNQVGVYDISGKSSLTALNPVLGSPFASGGTATSVLALNDEGTYLFAANGSSRNITSFSINPASGSLSGVSLQPINTVGDTHLITGMVYVSQLTNIYLPLIIE